jgi:hypothetical protein
MTLPDTSTSFAVSKLCQQPHTQVFFRLLTTQLRPENTTELCKLLQKMDDTVMIGDINVPDIDWEDTPYHCH